MPNTFTTTLLHCTTLRQSVLEPNSLYLTGGEIRNLNDFDRLIDDLQRTRTAVNTFFQKPAWSHSELLGHLKLAYPGGLLLYNHTYSLEQTLTGCNAIYIIPANDGDNILLAYPDICRHNQRLDLIHWKGSNVADLLKPYKSLAIYRL